MHDYSNRSIKSIIILAAKYFTFVVIKFQYYNRDAKEKRKVQESLRVSLDLLNNCIRVIYLTSTKNAACLFVVGPEDTTLFVEKYQIQYGWNDRPVRSPRQAAGRLFKIYNLLYLGSKSS